MNSVEVVEIIRKHKATGCPECGRKNIHVKECSVRAQLLSAIEMMSKE